MQHRPFSGLSVSLLLAVSALTVGCGGDASPTDAGPVDAGPPDAQPASTARCAYVPLPATAGAGGTVEVGTLSAGAAERPISIPLGVTLGAYTGRAEGFGREGFIDDRRAALAGSFATSVGIELWPRVRGVALTTGAYDASRPAGDTTILMLKMDVGATYQGLLHELEARLGPEYAGHVLIGSSHSHGSFANFDGHSALQVGFGQFRRTAFEALLDDLEAVAREALANRRPARIGIAHEGAFDTDDRVTRDRRHENDDLAGESRDDRDLFVIRIDDTEGGPIALIPVFGMHGTILGADNVMASGDAPGGLERVLEDQFDRPVVVMHYQGAGGDVSPAGLEGSSDCDGREFCADFARVESIGWRARDAVLAAYATAGASMRDTIDAEMVTRSVARGPDWRDFTVREGALEYAPFVEGRRPDFVVWDDPDTRTMVHSPVDEWNSPLGAALCGGGLAPPFGQMPGASDPRLRDTPYASCNMLNDRVRNLFETALGVPLDASPMCDITRTTVSALRLGDYLFTTLPGEPVTLLADRVRALMPIDSAHEVVIGYAQDHGGYMMTAEDWLRGGYEPTITFWGPLEGEMVAEAAARLVPLVMTPAREDGAAGGLGRVPVPMVDDGITPDPLPAAPFVLGNLEASPSYLLTQALPAVPAPEPPASLARLESAFFTWIGADPLRGTPTVFVERETSPGAWEVVRRASGRPVSDAAVLLTWTPAPLNPEPGVQRIHYWTAQWQAVNWADRARAGDEPRARLADRVGAPLGRYSLHVVGPLDRATGAPLYEVRSSAFDLTPAPMDVVARAEGGTLSLELGFRAAEGYRLLDPDTGPKRRFPLRGGVVQVSFDGAPAVSLTVDIDGRGAVSAPASFASVVITDEFGNRGEYRP